MQDRNFRGGQITQPFPKKDPLTHISLPHAGEIARRLADPPRAPSNHATGPTDIDLRDDLTLDAGIDTETSGDVI